MPPAPPLVCLLSAAHPPADVRVVAKEGAALAAAGAAGVVLLRRRTGQEG